jgi:mRNA interferase RelE/StbE
LTFRVLLEKKAAKQIEKLPVNIRSRILEALKELEKGFSARLDVKKLKGTKNHFRIRVGEYRILFALNFENAYVHDISQRESVYE